MCKIVPFLMLLAVPSNESKTNDTGIAFLKKSTGTDRDHHCSNDTTCPTWLTYTAEKKCGCDNKHKNKIVCDNEAQTSAVLNCNCVKNFTGENFRQSWHSCTA